MIRVTNLTKRYGARTAVDDLSFDVAAGRVTGFVGPNGAGKSTTMRAMVGLTRPDAGEVRYDGHRYIDLATPASVVGSVLGTPAAAIPAAARGTTFAPRRRSAACPPSVWARPWPPWD